MTRLGIVRHISRYPVKSMRGERLEETSLGFQGLPGDRRYAFAQKKGRFQFPWFTGRELHELLLYVPRYDPADPRQVLVTTPSGTTLSLESDELRAELETKSSRGPLFLLSD